MKLQYIKQTCAGHLRLKRGPWVLESCNQASPSWWEQPIGKCQGPSGLKKLPENRWQGYWIQIWVKTVLYNLLAIGCWSHKLTFLSLNLSSCKMRLNVYTNVYAAVRSRIIDIGTVIILCLLFIIHSFKLIFVYVDIHT